MSSHSVSYAKICTRPWEELVVYPNGEYSICCGGPPIGKIEHISEIKNIWNSLPVLQYRDHLNRGVEFGICKNCIFHGTLRNTEYKEHVRQKMDVRLDKIPVISFGLTDQCNLSCFMCGVSKKYAGTNRKLTADRLPLVYCREFAEHHFETADIVNSNCFGELFLYPDLKPFLRLLKEHRPKAYTTSTSSGSLPVSERIWRMVMESHDRFTFSVDTHDARLHRVIRGFDYAVFEANIRKVKKLQEADYPGFKYGCSVVLMKLTIGGVFETLRKAHEEYGCRMFHFQNVSGVPSQSLADEKQWRVLYNSVMTDTLEYIARHGIETNGDIGLFLDGQGRVEA
ncbi:MAG: radical SAM protein [Acidobacteriota bacterium]